MTLNTYDGGLIRATLERGKGEGVAGVSGDVGTSLQCLGSRSNNLPRNAWSALRRCGVIRHKCRPLLVPTLPPASQKANGMWFWSQDGRAVMLLALLHRLQHHLTEVAAKSLFPAPYFQVTHEKVSSQTPKSRLIVFLQPPPEGATF